MLHYHPPFTLTSEIVSLVAAIAEQVGRLSAQSGSGMDLRLRRINRIRTVTGSLAIEGNTLSEEQITSILDGKQVLAPPRELQEARNALAVYEQLHTWDGLSEADLLAAHRMLMQGLLDVPGTYRSGGAGVMAGDKVLHMAPPANRVPALMAQLFGWLQNSQEHPLIASSVFHYELEFIHPFADGNGRMGRLWQTLLLSSGSRPLPGFPWKASCTGSRRLITGPSMPAPTPRTVRLSSSSCSAAFMRRCWTSPPKTPLKIPPKSSDCSRCWARSH